MKHFNTSLQASFINPIVTLIKHFRCSEEVFARFCVDNNVTQDEILELPLTEEELQDNTCYKGCSGVYTKCTRGDGETKLKIGDHEKTLKSNIHRKHKITVSSFDCKHHIY